jgi:hypothetical protein
MSHMMGVLTYAPLCNYLAASLLSAGSEDLQSIMDIPPVMCVNPDAQSALTTPAQSPSMHLRRQSAGGIVAAAAAAAAVSISPRHSLANGHTPPSPSRPTDDEVGGALVGGGGGGGGVGRPLAADTM